MHDVRRNSRRADSSLPPRSENPAGGAVRSAISFFGRAALLTGGLALASLGVALASLVSTTLDDFHQPGTQPGDLNTVILHSSGCSFCHGYLDPPTGPYQGWSASMMAQAGRDPVFWAALAVANQDAAFAGEFCLRCHAPGGWLAGNSVPPDGSGLVPDDFDGVSCQVCHRLVDPIADPNDNPVEDTDILAALAELPTGSHGGQYVVDPEDRRRGPRDLGPEFFYHEWRRSPFHRESMLCATCHEVSNPVFTRQKDGTYALGPLDQPHPTHLRGDEFPIERTFSEWANSIYAAGPVDVGGRFGGNRPAVSSCQDCHMPATAGYSCNPILSPQYRPDLALHEFHGGNTWVLKAVRALYPDEETGLSAAAVDGALARTAALLQAASDLEVTQAGEVVIARVINHTGHKLPTGYPEGRRMWVNVRFLDSRGALVAERGHYDAANAVLTTGDTKVYETHLAIGPNVAAATGLPEGPSFHFALNNVRAFDNRIPPPGFTNAAFAAVQAEPVGYAYADGQHWDDTAYPIPAGARSVEVRVFFQTTSKEYIEFLRDTNTTNAAGQLAYDQWVLHGRSAPAEMDFVSLRLTVPGDLTGDGHVRQDDLAALLASYGVNAGGDVNGDGYTDQADLAILLAYYEP